MEDKGNGQPVNAMDLASRAANGLYEAAKRGDHSGAVAYARLYHILCQPFGGESR